MHEAEQSDAQPCKTDYNDLTQQKPIFIQYHNIDPESKIVRIKYNAANTCCRVVKRYWRYLV